MIGAGNKGQKAVPFSLPAPIRGLNARDPIAQIPPMFAYKFTNFWPREGVVEMRKGAETRNTGLGSFVRSLHEYAPASGSRKLFASTATAVYDVTASGPVGSAVFTCLSGNWKSCNFSNTGGNWLFMANAVDAPRRFDGSTWTTLADFPIHGSGTLPAASVKAILPYKRQLFFLRADSSNYYSLPADQITGTVYQHTIGPLLSKGGSIRAFASWSIDGGDGMDDMLVLVSSEGQAVVYAGTDPTNFATWSLRGVYDLPKPIGSNCFLKFAGDLLYLSESGLMPLSAALSQQATPNLGITSSISGAFIQAAKSYNGLYGWDMAFHGEENCLIVNVPTVESASSFQYASNVGTGAWTRFEGWNASCFLSTNEGLLFGSEGTVGLAFAGFSDFGASVTAEAALGFTNFGYPGVKSFGLVRPSLSYNASANISLGVDVDYALSVGYTAETFVETVGSQWGEAQWGIDAWAGDQLIFDQWMQPSCHDGRAFSVRLRCISSNGTMQWFSTDFLYTPGGIL